MNYVHAQTFSIQTNVNESGYKEKLLSMKDDKIDHLSQKMDDVIEFISSMNKKTQASPIQVDNSE